MSKNGMMAAVAAAAGLGDTPEKLDVTPELIAQHFPAVAKHFSDEGAKAEFDRIQSIEKAAMPGHEAIIAAHKADRSKTGADAALAVIAAENSTRTAVLGKLAKDEEGLKGLRNAPIESAAAPETTASSVVDLKAEAQTYINEQAKLGVTVDPATAVAFVKQKKG
jgi:hypothetical protein